MAKVTAKPNKYASASKSIFVGGLDNRVTEEILWELFLQAGPLESVRIPINKESGKPRSFGFVVYQDSCSVSYACELFNSLRLFGRSITCKPQNSNDNARQENPGRSPTNINSSSEEELNNQRRYDEVNKTPPMQFIGVDESPYGRAPNMITNRSQHPLNRTFGGPPYSVNPLMGLRKQTLMNQSFPNRMGGVGLLATPGPSRRDRFSRERQQNFDNRDRRQRPY